jgi:hypothetical protein
MIGSALMRRLEHEDCEVLTVERSAGCASICGRSQDVSPIARSAAFCCIHPVATSPSAYGHQHEGREALDELVVARGDAP